MGNFLISAAAGFFNSGMISSNTSIYIMEVDGWRKESSDQFDLVEEWVVRLVPSSTSTLSIKTYRINEM